MAHGFLYLVAIMDGYSRDFLAWRVSNTLGADFCVAALAEALGQGRRESFNTDQGSQSTSDVFTALWHGQHIQISEERPHQALNYQRPRQLFEAQGQPWTWISGLGLEPISVVLLTRNAAGRCLNLASSPSK